MNEKLFLVETARNNYKDSKFSIFKYFKFLFLNPVHTRKGSKYGLSWIKNNKWHGTFKMCPIQKLKKAEQISLKNVCCQTGDK